MGSILKKFSHGLRTASVVALLVVGTYAASAQLREGHPDTYVVKRGDTLWDIAGRFLQKPWLWPEIWQANPQIKNPHLIYPGDVISLAYLDRVGVTPGPRDEAPINAVPLSEVEAYLRDLRVVQSFRELPYVVGIEEDRTRYTRGRMVYVKGLEGASVGQRYAIVRPTVRYVRLKEARGTESNQVRDYDYRGRHVPGYGWGWSESSANETGEELGHELYKVNAGAVTRLPEGDVEVTTVLLDSQEVEVRVGDRLIPVDAQPYDLQFFPHPPKQAIDPDRVRVLAVANSLTSGGTRDVVAISAGSADGIDNGTVLSLWRQGSNVVDRVESSILSRGEESVPRGQRVRLPDEYASHVMIFRTFENVSYGLIMESTAPTRVGYRARHPDAK